MIELIKELEQNNIGISLDNNDLRLNYEGDDIDAEILNKLKGNKEELITYLRKYSNLQAHENIPVLAKQGNYKLSSSQFRMWVLSQSKEASVAYNVPNYLTLEGDYNIACFKKAIESTVDRHESLRTIFKEDSNGEIKQWILTRKEIDFKVDYLDFRSNSNGEKLVKDYIVNDSSRVFDLANGPLFRVCLFQLSEDSYVFYYNMHHIISDTWSMEILAKDVLAYYNYYEKNETLDLPVLDIQYKDFSAWQIDELKGEKHNKHREYWHNVFSVDLPALDLPSNKLRPKVKTYNGHNLGTYISRDTTEKLNKFCQSNGGSLYIGLLAAWYVILHKYTSVNDICIGTTIAGREHLDLKHQIGCYINTLALRNEINPDETFNQFFYRIKESTLSAYAHQIYPFDDVLGSLNVKHNTSRGVLFDVMFLLQNALENQHNPVISEEKFEKIRDLGLKTALTDIDVNIVEEGDYLSFNVTFNTDVYEQSMIERLMRHYKSMICELLDNPDKKICSVDYMGIQEKNELLEEFNNTDEAFLENKTLIDLFSEQVNKTPNKVALIFENKEFTYEHLNQLSNQFADFLSSLCPIESDDLIGIKLERNEWMIVAVLGVLKSKGAYVPIDPTYPKQRIEYIESDSNCKIIVNENTIKSFQKKIGKYDKNFVTQGVKSCDLAYVIYTSGSTGQPKGVMIEHKNAVSFLQNMDDNFQFKNYDTIAGTTNIVFDIAFLEIFGSLCSGRKLVLFSSEELMLPDLFVSNLLKNKVQILQVTPSRFNLLSPILESTILPDLKQILIGGEAFPKTLFNNINNFQGINFINVYGPTEATIWSTCLNINKSKYLSIGKPLLNEQVYVLSEKLELQPIGVVGELCISGTGLSRGYLNREDLTKEKFIAHPFKEGARLYKTGDLAKWSPDGTIVFLGRKDDQVKIRGHRIELGEIEHFLQKQPSIVQSIVMIQKVKGSDVLVGYLVSNEVLDTDRIRKSLSSELPDYMIPNYYVALEKLPLTPNGKVDRKVLSSFDVVGSCPKKEYLAPRSIEEKILTEVWEEVLNKDKIGIRDNFYDLGGDSIKSIQILYILKQKGYILKLEDIMQSKIIEDLSILMEVDNDTIDQSLVEGNIPLTPIQCHFFEEPSFVVHNHFNQSIALQSHTLIDTSILKKCIAKIVIHHDVLRTLFYKENNFWKQHNRGVSIEENYYSYNFNDLREEPNASLLMAKLSNDIQSSFDLEKGPLLKVAHFRLQDGDHIAFMIHHLVVDGVSWRIILEDLVTLYEQYKAGKEALLPPKTNSYQLWALKLQEYANRSQLNKEVSYWENLHATSIADFPKDIDCNDTVLHYNEQQSFSLDKRTTKLLQNKVNGVYGTEINEILLTALGLSLKKVFGVDQSIIKMEGHGREDIIENIDVSRTVGWFTSIYPFILDVSSSGEMIKSLLAVKKNLRKIPNKGVGYSILRYLTDDFKSVLKPSVEFNYLGDFGSDIGNKEATVFKFASDNIGSDSDSKNGRDCLLSVTGMISNDQLQLSVGYTTSIYLQTTIKNFVKVYNGNLIDLIEALAIEGEKKKGSSVSLNNHTPLDYLNGPTFNIEKEFDLSGNQFFIMNMTQSQGILGSISIPKCSRAIFEQKLREFIRLYPILTTSFKLKKGNIVQCYTSSDTVEIDIYFSKKRYNIKNTLQVVYSKLKQPFDLINGPLIRAYMIDNHLEKNESLLFLSIHHSLTDLYSNQILYKNLVKFFENNPVDVEYKTNFDFVLWQKNFLNSRLGIDHRKFWITSLKQLDLKKTNKTSGFLPSTIEQTKSIQLWRKCVKKMNPFISLFKQAQKPKVINAISCVTQTLILSELEFEKLKEITRKNNVPISAIFLSAYQNLLHELLPPKKCLQLILVNGREQMIDGFNTDRLLGVMNNFLPLPIISSTDKLNRKHISKVYTEYMKARLYQSIPYETIKKDFLLEEGEDIDLYVGGIFNFQMNQDVTINNDSVNRKLSIELDKNDFTKGIDLTCVVYSNTVKLTLTCSKKLYKNLKKSIALDSFIKKELL